MRKKLYKIMAIAVIAGLVAGSMKPMQAEAARKKRHEKPVKVSEVSEKDLYRKHKSKIQCVVVFDDEKDIKKKLNSSEYEVMTEAERSATVMLSEEEIDNLNETEGVIVEPDFLLEAMDAETDAIQTLAEEQWNIRAVNADCDIVGENDNIKIAVIDSGMDFGEDITIAESIDLVNPDIPLSGMDMTGHGTAIGGIIGASDNEIGTTGVADGIPIYSIRVLDENNQAPVSRIIEAVSWCINNDVDIINMSFGTQYDSVALQEVIKEAEKAGILMIGSAGNLSPNVGDVVYPAAYEEVIAVGAVDSYCMPSRGTVLGEEIDFMAPGENVPLNSFYDGVTIGTGSSYAAAHVTAVAARLWSMDSSKDAEFIRNLMQASAVRMEQDDTGYGLVDLSYAKQIYREFERNYDGENGEEISISENSSVSGNNIVSENNTGVDIYEIPAYVQANWNAVGHKHLVTAGSEESSLTSAELKLLKNASIWSDSYLQKDDFTTNSEFKDYLMEYKLFHAAGYKNYVAVTKYLYNVAVRIKNGVSIANACKVTEYAPSNESASEIEKQKTTMTIAIKKICDATVSGQEEVTNTANRNGLKVLGIALHVAGDAYAHKSMVAMDAMDAIVAAGSNYFTDADLSTLENKISKNKLTFAGIVGIGNLDDGEKKDLHAATADNTKVSPKRYSRGAKWTVTKLITWYEASNNNDRHYFTMEAFYPNMDDKNYYPYRQYKLVTYTKATYKGKLPTVGNKVTASDWAALSACD